MPDGEAATITLSYGGRRLVFTPTFSGCEGILVTANGIAQPDLVQTEAFTTTLHKVLGVTHAQDPDIPAAGKK